MKKLLFYLLAVAFSVSLPAQKPYFQQWVDYTIKVKVDPVSKTLSAWEKMVYYNNSPDTLHYIYIHLWPNAYQKHTDLCRQLASNGREKLRFGPDEYRGYIDSLDFRSNGKKLQWQQYNYKKDIAVLYLPKPLAPGDSIVITTPFFVKIPRITSRMGYDDKVIAISQWYPKPAVYDNRGWHPIPYLDQGEFYSEFGSFDVEITLPSQYAVAATGNMLDSTEYKWRLMLSSRKAMEVPYPNGKQTKTVHFHQDSVHDFAFFLSDQYYARRSSIKLPHSGRVVETWAFFTDTASDWKNAVNYVDSALYYYSLWVGDYPYKVCTAVEGPLSAGGGMEYPTITVISSSGGLEQVVVHEVGHNWFYGVLGFNERRYPFMDEGINSFYDHRYSRMRGLGSFMSAYVFGRPMPSLPELLSVAAYNGMNQPLDLHSLDYTTATYGLVVYEKTAFSLHYLQQYLGTQEFDRIMQKFYKKWLFRHPYPEDLKRCFEQNATKPVDWFFDDVVGTNKTIDYGLHATGKGVVLKNTGMVKAPIIVATPQDTTWYLLQPGAKQTVASKGTYTRIDPQNITLDLNHYNNFTRGHWPDKPLKISLLPHVFSYEYNYLTIMPLVYLRYYDGFMPGAMVTNYTIPWHSLSYAIAGFYGLKTHQPSGMVYFNYQRPPVNGMPMIGLSAYADNYAINGDQSFGRVRKAYVYLKIGLWNKDNSDHWHKELKIGYIRIQDRPASYRNEFGMRLTAHKQGKLHPASLQAMAMRAYNLPMQWVGTNPVNIFSASMQVMALHYVSLNTGLTIRTFVGMNAPVMAMNMETDFDYSHGFVTRYDSTSIWRNQVAMEYGGFLLNTPEVIYPWSAGMNVTTTMPVKLLSFVQGYFNVAYVPQDKWMYETGLKLAVGGIEVYLPLYANDVIMAANPGFRPLHTYRFSISMDMSKLVKF